MILVQISRRHVEKLVQCLATWPNIEVLIFVSELMILSGVVHLSHSMLGPTSDGLHRLFKPQKRLILKQSSLGSQTNHSMESIIIFFNRLAQASTLTGRAMLEGGVLDLLLQLYLRNFSNPLALHMFRGRLTLRKACDTLFGTLSKTEQGLNP